MSIADKKGKAYNCLMNYRNNCNSEEHKKLIDIFFPMLYKVNKSHLTINTGMYFPDVRRNNTCLRVDTSDFIVGVDHWNNEPQLIFKYTENKIPIVLFNIAMIKDLYIKTREHTYFYIYDIRFKYIDDIIYNIKITINK